MIQSTSTVLMIRPASFGFNEETAVNNFFQDNTTELTESIQLKALGEFDLMVKRLRQHEIEVWVINDTPDDAKPDAVFPNNWLSCFNGTLTIYPMFAKNRRIEKRDDIIQYLCAKIPELKLLDLSNHESVNSFLEGTGSIVCDHTNRIMYACISERTDKKLFHEFAISSDYKPVSFIAKDSQEREIYHTNVMMCIADKFAVICTEAITDVEQRENVIQSLTATKHEIININLSQVNNFAGNMLQLHNNNNEPFLIMSNSAYQALTPDQLAQIKKHAAPLVMDVSSIEKTGGGSVRCMIAEIFK